MQVHLNTPVNPELAANANELVNQVFYGSLLREFHRENHNALFGNGPGGMTFVRQLDMELIKRMSGSKPTPLAMNLIRALSPAATVNAGDFRRQVAGRTVAQEAAAPALLSSGDKQ